MERPTAREPYHRIVEAGVTGVCGDVHADVFQLSRGLVIIIPCGDLGRVDTGLAECVIVVEERHRPGIHG